MGLATSNQSESLERMAGLTYTDPSFSAPDSVPFAGVFAKWNDQPELRIAGFRQHLRHNPITKGVPCLVLNASVRRNLELQSCL